MNDKTIDILDPSGVMIRQHTWSASCSRKFSLMNEDSVTLRFSTHDAMKFPVGSSVGDFFITQEQVGKWNASTGVWDYELKFDAYYWLWANRILRYVIPGVDSAKETSFTLTATIDVHAQVILNCLGFLGIRYNNSPFHVDADDTVPGEAKLVRYENLSVLGGIQAIAEAFGCEWWVIGNAIYFGRCENGDSGHVFEAGVNVSTITFQQAKSEAPNRLYVYGSDRNLPTNYRKAEGNDTIGGVVVHRLMLPEGTPYLQMEPNIPESQIVEKVVVLDSVYPRTDLTVSEQPETYSSTTEDEEGNENSETFYRLKYGDSFLFSESYVLPNEELHIIFQSGLLNGMEFGAKFNPKGLNEKNTDGSWNPEAQMLEVVANEDYGRKLPDDILRPCKGDKFILSGWDSSKMADLGLISDAEQELLVEGQKAMEEYTKDLSTCTCPMAWDYMKPLFATNTQPGPGDVVTIIDTAHFGEGGRKSRIIGFEYKIDKPYAECTYTCGENISVKRLDSIEKKIEGLAKSGTKVQIQNSLDFLSKRYSDRTPYDLAVGGKLTGEGGVQFGKSFVPGIVGGVGGFIDSNGEGELESLVIRRFLEVPELRYNRTDVIIGNDWNAPGGGIISKVVVDKDADGNTLDTGTVYLKLEDGEPGAVYVGAISQGIFHFDNPACNATEDSDDGKGNFMFAGFATIYFRITEVGDYDEVIPLFDENGNPKLDENGAQKTRTVTRHNGMFRYKLRQDWITMYHPQEMMTFVCYGTFDQSDYARSCSSYSTRSYKRYLANVHDWEWGEGNIMAQFGDLSNLSIGGVNMSGYSAYLNNIYFTGHWQEVAAPLRLSLSLASTMLEKDTDTLTIKGVVTHSDTTLPNDAEGLTWSARRESGDIASDAEWTPEFSAAGELKIKASDFNGRESCLFFLSATYQGDTATQGTTLFRAEGIAGRYLTGTEVKYAKATTSVVNDPEALSWSSDVPSVGAGEWLWKRITETYSKAPSPVVSYDVSAPGEKGDKGDPGSNAKIVVVNADAMAFVYKNDFGELVGPTSIKLSATLQGTTGYQWSYKRAGENGFTIISGAQGGENPTLNIYVDGICFGDADNRSVTVRCTSGGVYDEVTLVKVSSGGNGEDGTSYTPNLLKEANVKLNSLIYRIGGYNWDNRPPSGTKCTLTICACVGSKDESITIHQNMGYDWIGSFTSKTETIQSFPFTVKDNSSSSNTCIDFYHNPNDSNYDLGTYIKWVVVTIGEDSVLAWVPAASEMLGKDAYTVLLTNECHVFEGDTEKAIDGSTSSQIIAYKGATLVAATIGTITGMPTGMTVVISNNGTTTAKFTVNVTTALTTKQGTLNVPVTVDGKTFTLVFSWSLSLKGEQGHSIVASVSRQNFTEATWNTYGTIDGTTEVNWTGTESLSKDCRVGDYFRIYGTATDTGNSHVLIYRCTVKQATLKGVCVSHEVTKAGKDGKDGSNATTNLLCNSAFKKGSNCLEGWGLTPNGGEIHAPDPNVRVSAQYNTVYINNSDTATNTYTVMSQAVPIIKGKKYTVSVECKGSILGGGRFGRVEIHSLKNGSRISGTAEYINAPHSENMQRMSHIYTPHADADSIQIVLGAFNIAKAWFAAPKVEEGENLFPVWSPDAMSLYGDKGDKGETGIAGVSFRMTEFKIGTYYNDGSVGHEEDGVRVLDIVTVRNATNGTRSLWQCKKYLNASDNTAVNQNIVGPSENSEYWQAFNSTTKPIYTPLLLADGAKIDFINGQEILLYDTNGKIISRLGYPSDGNTIMFAGGGTSGESTYLLDKLGRARFGKNTENDKERIEIDPTEGNRNIKIYDKNGALCTTLDGKQVPTIKGQGYLKKLEIGDIKDQQGNKTFTFKDPNSNQEIFQAGSENNGKIRLDCESTVIELKVSANSRLDVTAVLYLEIDTLNDNFNPNSASYSKKSISTKSLSINHPTQNTLEFLVIEGAIQLFDIGPNYYYRLKLDVTVDNRSISTANGSYAYWEKPYKTTVWAKYYYGKYQSVYGKNGLAVSQNSDNFASFTINNDVLEGDLVSRGYSLYPKLIYNGVITSDYLQKGPGNARVLEGVNPYKITGYISSNPEYLVYINLNTTAINNMVPNGGLDLDRLIVNVLPMNVSTNYSMPTVTKSYSGKQLAIYCPKITVSNNAMTLTNSLCPFYLTIMVV